MIAMVLRKRWINVLILTLLPALMGVVINNATVTNVAFAGSSGLANLRVSMLGTSLGYDTSGSVYPEPAGITFGVTNFPRVVVQTFNDTATEDCIWGQFTVPSDYVANPSIVAVWSSATGGTANVADFEFKYKYVTGAATLDAATETPLNPGTFADPDSARLRQVSDLGAPSTGIAANATMLWGFCRDGADGDTIADQLHLYDLMLEYDS